MSPRTGAIAGGVLLLTLTACGRAPPSPSAENGAPTPAAAETAPVELAGGLPADAPPSSAPDSGPAAGAIPPDASAPSPTDPANPRPLVRVSRSPVLDGPAPTLAGGPEDVWRKDPLEPMNRRLYAVDRVVGDTVVRPARMLGHRRTHSSAFMTAARNVLDNLDEPDVAANDLLQRKFGRALTSAARFVINSTLGLVGISDAAGKMGLKRQSNNIDRTLASYGAPAGPYLFLPIVGPTTLRAAMGAVAVSYLYPPHWLHLATGVGVTLRAASYAQLAGSALTRANPTLQAAPGHDGYLKARKTYFEARGGPKTSDGAPPARPGETTMISTAAPSLQDPSGGGSLRRLKDAPGQHAMLLEIEEQNR